MLCTYTEPAVASTGHRWIHLSDFSLTDYSALYIQKMKTSALVVISACLCAFGGAKADDGSGYVAPVPLREAVTVTGPPADINDDTAVVTDTVNTMGFLFG